jgi:Calx-beta domain
MKTIDRGTMTRTLVRTLFLCGLLLSVAGGLPNEAYAEQSVRIGSACQDPTAKHVSMYYVNGINTTYIQAVHNYQALGQFIFSSSVVLTTLAAKKMCLDLSFKYNPSAGLILDFIESGQQLDKLLTPSALRQWFVLGVVALNSPVLRPLVEYIGSRVADSDLINQTVIAEHAATYETDLRACRSVLLVPHSQGNLYVHQEHDLLYNKLRGQTPPLQELLLDGLRIVGVASPDAEEAVFHSPTGYEGRYKWRTSGTDLVMGAVTPYLQSKGYRRLESNTDWSGIEFDDWLLKSFGHAFDGYLGINNAKTHILEAFKAQLQALPSGGCPQFSKETYTAAAGAKTADITIVRSSAVNSETVNFVTVSGGGTAVSGQDYLPTVEPVTFAAGETTKTASVAIFKNPSRTSMRTLSLKINPGETTTPLGQKITAILEIPPDTKQDPTCLDGNQNIHAEVTLQEYTIVGDTQNQPSPSINLSLGAVSGSAGGSKGNASVSTSFTAMNSSSNLADARMNYGDAFLIASPGKSGSGTALFSLASSAVVNISCFPGDSSWPRDSINAYANVEVSSPSFPLIYTGIGRKQDCGSPSEGIPQHTSALFSFTYGVPVRLSVSLQGAVRNGWFTRYPSGSSAQASASVGYSVTVQDDPGATVTWCRATQ